MGNIGNIITKPMVCNSKVQYDDLGTIMTNPKLYHTLRSLLIYKHPSTLLCQISLGCI